MDRRERWSDPEEALRAALDGMQAGLWTSLPGTIVSYNATTQTVSVQPAIQAVITAQDGTQSHTTLPVLPDVPVQFPAGGGASLTFPVAAGDECLVVFASRSIDAWAQSGGVQRATDARLHDLSDGFALLGFRSGPRALAGVSTTSVQLRSDDGANVVDIAPGSGAVSVTARTRIALTVGGVALALTAAGASLTGGQKLITDGEVDALGPVKVNGTTLAVP